MLESVTESIARYKMISPGARVAAAVSGGPDSVCLLHALLEIAPRLEIRVTGIAHVNHKLRGAESLGDRLFVERLAGSWSLPFYSMDAPIPAEAGNLEQAARRLRREFFASIVREGKATHIALGHTRDDQAETVLFRLLRGSGISGLAGILPVTRDGIVRPLLGTSRAEVLEFLSSRGIEYRCDSSNRDLRFARNRIREELLPQLERKWNPGLRQALSQLADLAYHEELWWEMETARIGASVLSAGDGWIEIDARKTASLPPAAARRVARYAIRQVKGDLRSVTFHHVASVLELLRGEKGAGKLILPGVVVNRSFAKIRLSASGPGRQISAQAVAVPGVYRAPSGNSLIHLELTPLKPAAEACGTLEVDLCWSKVPKKIELRGWRPGDHYQPAGYSRDQKLKEMFQRARIPSWERPVWPILSSGDKILWAKNFGVAAEFAPAAATDQRLRIRETPVG
jgi:tRNA(Ile)-lysidine synthase